MASSDDFETSELDSILNVLNLSPTDPLDTFAEMWYQVFLWTLFSSFIVYNVAAVVAFVTLRKHKQGRYLPVIVSLSGILSPLTVGLVTSAAIAGVYRASRFQMMPLYALVWGVGQTFLGAVMAFTRILATL